MTALPSQLQSIITANGAVYRTFLTETSIRIMKLHPGLGYEDIFCSFVVVDLDHVESFYALSYCWGNEPADRAIFCNEQQFRVTRNLYTALKQLRLVSEVRYMWIDAVCCLSYSSSKQKLIFLRDQVCINQDSIAERNQQVPLMGQIYQKATGVIVWLGEEDDTTALALATMRNIFESCYSNLFGPANHEDWLVSLENDENIWQVLRGDIVKTASPGWPEAPETCAKALQAFFKRPWFSRIWVIQEVQGSPHILVQVGETTVTWNIVALAAAWVVYAPSPVTHINEPYKFGGFLHTDLMRQRLLTTKDDVPFLEVLDRCRGFNCTIDKDRIFALLQHPAARLDGTDNEYGPAMKVIHPLRIDIDRYTSHFGLKADYNMTLFEVYRQVVLRSISEGCSLQVLSHAIEDHSYRKEYPTWMPVWHAKSSRFTGPRRTFLYNASRGYSPQLRTLTNPMLISLRGLMVGRVTETSTNIKFFNQKSQQTEGIQYGTTLREIWEISRLIVRDCWQPEHNWLQDSVCRTNSQLDIHFKDFCAFMTERLQNTSGLNFLSLHGKWCDICMTRHTVSPATGMDEALQILHCETCFDFDMCISCHKSGHTCPDRHVLSPRPIPSIICQLDEQIQSVLEAEKGDGNSQRFDLGVRQSFDQQSFVKLDNGLLGVGSDATRPKDLVVIFFGGRVPFILRQHDSYCTLIGECYIHGLMDGEAINAWHEGKLREETFVLA